MYISNGSTYFKDYNMVNIQQYSFLFIEKQTQGVDIQTKLLLGENGEKDIEFYFFDAGGHPIFRPIIEGVVRLCSSILNNKFIQFKNADYVILVFDCTNKGSFEYIAKAYDDLKKANGKSVPGKKNC